MTRAVRLFALFAGAAVAACAAPGKNMAPVAAAPARPAPVQPSPAQPAPPKPAPAPASGMATSLPLVNAGFEGGMKTGGRCAMGWDCTMHNNPDSFRFLVAEGGAAAGNRSLCIERVVDEPWALATQVVPVELVRGKRVRLSMQVKVEGVTGSGAGPWLLAQGRPVANASRLVKGTAGWQPLSVDLAVPQGASVLELGATLEGPGRACFDDVRLEVL